MGSIDLDPASSKKANRIVKATAFYTQDKATAFYTQDKATAFYTQDTDGLSKQWNGNVFMNPSFQATLIKRFVDKLCSHSDAGDVLQSIASRNRNDRKTTPFAPSPLARIGSELTLCGLRCV
jgi:hypothetical protein